MKNFNLMIDERLFNLLWRALAAREEGLAAEMENSDSDEAALAGNDLVYLRLARADLEKLARTAEFPGTAFSLDPGYVDLSKL